jgi:glycine/D-amino acid oxidase-like deaminating enzyme
MAEPSVAPSLPPWWLDEALAAETETLPAPPLEGEVRADVAIIGGGYTGLWTALAVKELDPAAEVVVLEAEVCGWGPSGRNGGFLHGYWTHLPRLRSALGDEAALAVARASDAVIPSVREFCEGCGADIWLRVDGYLRVSTCPEQDAALDHAIRTAAELGAPEEAVPLSADEIAAQCNSPRFRRGVHFRDGATVQPARLARALRRAALERGIRLHESTRVTALRAGTPNTLETPNGRIQADEIVVATNAAETGWRPVARKLTNFGSYVVLTEPVPELLAEIGWTGGEAITDARTFIHYFRTTPDGRVLMGSGGGPIGRGGKIDERFSYDHAAAARAETGLRRLLPALAGARVERAWGGPIDVSADQLPFFGTVAGTRIHYGVGYSGHGVGPSWMGGKILASLALRRDDEWSSSPLVRTPAVSLPPEPFKRLGGAVIRAAVLAVEDAEEEGRRAPLVARAVAEIPRLLGLPLGRR